MIGAKVLTDEAVLRADPNEFDSIDTLKCIVAACEAAVDVLNDILCFDKMESRTMDLRTQSIGILTFLSDSINMFSPIAFEKKIALHRFLKCGDYKPSTSPLVQQSAHELTHDDFIDIDIFKMRQVIRNILSNALKFTPPNGEITIRAWISTDKVDASTSPLVEKTSQRRSPTADFEVDGSDIELGESIQETVYSKLIIEIKDTGAGFDDMHRDKVFKEVFQFKPEVLQGGGGRYRIPVENYNIIIIQLILN